MGLFLSLSGVVGGTVDETTAALAEFATAHSGEMKPMQPAKDDESVLVVAPGAGGVSALYPYEFTGWDEASGFLSKRLGNPVFSFHIHDGDLWMFYLYVDGEEVTGFNPIPDYWGDISPKEAALLGGNADLVAKYVPGVGASSIERYFVRWDLDAAERAKAYPDDEYETCSEWQLVDFMKKLGLVYPMDDRGNRLGHCFRFTTDLE